MSTEPEDQTINTQPIDQLCHIFELALKDTEARHGNGIFPPTEIEWLFRKSYNVALQLVKSSRQKSVMRLLDQSMRLADVYQRLKEHKDEIRLCEHYLSCYFLKSIVLITEARDKSDPLGKETHYNEIRNAVQCFRTYHSQLQQIDSNRTTGLLSKWQKHYGTLLSFDFEAAILLKHWDSLPCLIEESSAIIDGKLSALFLESIIASEAPVSVMTRAVMTLINILHTTSSPCLSKSSFQASLPYYLRCLLHLSLEANEIPLAEAVIDKALSLAYESNLTNRRPSAISNGQSSKQEGHNTSYPNEELEWLATVTFNRAVDFYLSSADEECERWAGKAIEMADLVGGLLGRLLRANLAKLL